MTFKYLCDRYGVDPEEHRGAVRGCLDIARVLVRGGQNQLATQLVQAAGAVQNMPSHDDQDGGEEHASS